MAKQKTIGGKCSFKRVGLGMSTVSLGVGFNVSRPKVQGIWDMRNSRVVAEVAAGDDIDIDQSSLEFVGSDRLDWRPSRHGRRAFTNDTASITLTFARSELSPEQ